MSPAPLSSLCLDRDDMNADVITRNDGLNQDNAARLRGGRDSQLELGFTILPASSRSKFYRKLVGKEGDLANSTGFPVLAPELLSQIALYFPAIPYPYTPTSKDVGKPLPSLYLHRYNALKSLSETCRSLRMKCRPLLWQIVDVCMGPEHGGSSRSFRGSVGKAKGRLTNELTENLSKKLFAVLRLLSGKEGVQDLAQYVQTLNIIIPTHIPPDTVTELVDALKVMTNLRTLQIVGLPTPHIASMFSTSSTTSSSHHDGQGIKFPSVKNLILDSSAYPILPCFPNVVRIYLSLYSFSALAALDQHQGSRIRRIGEPEPPDPRLVGLTMVEELRKTMRGVAACIGEGCKAVEEFQVGNPGIEEDPRTWVNDEGPDDEAKANENMGLKPLEGSVVRAIVEAMPNLHVFPRLHVRPDTPQACVPYLFDHLPNLHTIYFNPADPLEACTLKFIGVITSVMGELSREEGIGRRCGLTVQTGDNAMMLPILGADEATIGRLPILPEMPDWSNFQLPLPPLPTLGGLAGQILSEGITMLGDEVGADDVGEWGY